ncbi:MAG: outer membrane beta-barrel protein [Candidatus Sulfotelmatobacter sp.]|jgi:opacity protein-like surface antigen
MIRLAVATIALTTLIGSFAFAQDSTPKVQVFGGYSLVNVDNGGLTGTIMDVNLRQRNGPFSTASTFNGWNAEAQFNANRWVGIVADFGGRYGTPITASSGVKLSGLPNGTGYSFLVGPVLSYRTKSRMTLFVHALFGLDRASLSASTISGGTSPVSSSATSYTDFAVALGGGLDYRVSRHFALRLAQLDDLETTHNLNKFYGSAFGTGLFYGLATHERNLRFSAGVALRF